MHQGPGELTEIHLNGKSAGRIRCDPRLVPAPGQYLLAHPAADSSAPLAHPVFNAGLCPGGFYAAPPLPASWLPGTQLALRGPLGKGFQLPPAARFVALAAFSAPSRVRRGENPARLLALVEPALAQNTAVILLTDDPPDGLPAAIEISPLAVLAETLRWADYLALDLPRASLPAALKLILDASYSGNGQAFIETSIPCAGMAECGVCAISLRRGYRLACKDGPVFDLKTLLE
jgi:dihydroorotate dehydrogenase electron transfer subunit